MRLLLPAAPPHIGDSDRRSPFARFAQRGTNCWAHISVAEHDHEKGLAQNSLAILIVYARITLTDGMEVSAMPTAGPGVTTLRLVPLAGDCLQYLSRSVYVI